MARKKGCKPQRLGARLNQMSSLLCSGLGVTGLAGVLALGHVQVFFFQEGQHRGSVFLIDARVAPGWHMLSLIPSISLCVNFSRLITSLHLGASLGLNTAWSR